MNGKLLSEARKIIAANEKDSGLKQIVALLKERFSHYDWVGIYLVEGNELVLHNFIGRPTPHTRIPLGEGICGAAVREKQSLIVPDVNADPRYLSCSVHTKSEIVVPILRGSEVYGEIDIDSDSPDAFTSNDQTVLENLSEMLLPYFERA